MTKNRRKNEKNVSFYLVIATFIWYNINMVNKNIKKRILWLKLVIKNYHSSHTFHTSNRLAHYRAELKQLEEKG